MLTVLRSGCIWLFPQWCCSNRWQIWLQSAVGSMVFHWLAIVIELCLVLGTQHSHSCFYVRQAVLDVVHEQSAESIGQIMQACVGEQ